MSNTDRVEKKTVLRAPRARVWRALTDSKQFGSWFGMRFDAPFLAGAKMTGTIAPTTVDPEIAEHQKPYEGFAFSIHVETIEPERFFSFRWHPHAVEPTRDYSSEPMTLVAFELEEVPGGTQLTVSESGFDGIPLDRRAKAFTANGEGWAIQLVLIGKFLEQTA
jgi:uncharacterized protein YndB with AHSA1/START domain